MLGVAFLITLAVGEGSGWNYEDIRRNDKPFDKYKLNFLTWFSVLKNYQVGATPVSEADYPWIARVVHSRENNSPHMCTAICIQQRIFITSLRCIYNLKVNYTSVIYMGAKHFVRAFVFPSQMTRQLFDDIGFLVVEPTYTGPWPTIDLFDKKRTDDSFKWFADLNLSKEASEYKVVGYSSEKDLDHVSIQNSIFDLTELSVTVGINMCQEIMSNGGKEGYHIPCYHSCNLKQFKTQEPECKRYHGVVGGAVFDTNKRILIGVATWGAHYSEFELPVGLAVPNSDSFFEDYACARRIRDDGDALVSAGYYQKLCNAV